MNSTYYKTLDENFNQALKLFDKNHSHKELLEMLCSGNLPQKQFAALHLEKVRSQSEAAVLVSNLAGQDGKIRDAVSVKINDFMHNENIREFFCSKNFYETFLEAVMDVNGNVCRNIISAVCCLKTNNDFTDYFCHILTEKILDLSEKTMSLKINDGKYKFNKDIFKLYWCLETLYEFSDYISLDVLKNVIIKTYTCPEYTVREKCAKILSKNFNDPELQSIQARLKRDSNYFVSRI